MQTIQSTTSDKFSGKRVSVFTLRNKRGTEKRGNSALMRVMRGLIPDHQYGVSKDCSWSDPESRNDPGSVRSHTG